MGRISTFFTQKDLSLCWKRLFFTLTFLLSIYPILFPKCVHADDRTLDGTIEVSIIDYTDGRAKEIVELVRPNQKRVLLNFSGKIPPQIRSGAKVLVRTASLADEGELAVSESDIDVTEPASQQYLTGTRSLVVVRVSSTDVPVHCTHSAIETLYWDGAQSVRGMYEASSNGALSFTSDINVDGQNDVYDVTLPYATGTGCDYGRYSTDAKAALLAQGVNLDNWNIRVYVIPGRDEWCGFAGVANVANGSGNSWIPEEFCNYLDITAHEIGHNLGLLHASLDLDNNGAVDPPGNPDPEYGDWSCLMGIGGVGARFFNAVHSYQQNWVPPEKVISGTGGGSFTIASVETDDASTANPYIVKVPRPAGNSYFISYREQLGNYSSGLRAEYRQRVTIHHGGNTSGYSYLVKILNVGESWTDPVANLTILFASRGTNSATVSLSGTSAAPSILSSIPPDGYIDPLGDRNAQSGALFGKSNIAITFSAPVMNVGGGPLSLSNFQIRYYRQGAEVPATSADLALGSAPLVSLVPVGSPGAGPYTIQFLPRVPLGAWTDIRAINVVSLSGVPVSTNNRDNRRAIAFLPMDTTQDGKVLGNDITRWTQISTGSFSTAPLLREDYIDQTRNGTVAGEDITRAIQLINGTATQRAWSAYDIGPRP